LPIKPYIIGKTVSMEVLDKTENEDFEIELVKVSTYVLDNLPTGLDNKSMGKNFSYEIKGIANLFVDYRSKPDYKPEEVVQVKPTLCVIRGKTKVKLFVRFKDEVHKYRFVLAEGDFSLNFPYAKDGKIADLLSVELYREEGDVDAQQVAGVFGAEPEEEKMKEEGKGDNK
jgi:hypothetical protein